MDSKERRAREGGVKRACRLERNRDRERARQLGKETSSARVGLNATESEQDTGDSGRDLKPEYRKD